MGVTGRGWGPFRGSTVEEPAGAGRSGVGEEGEARGARPWANYPMESRTGLLLVGLGFFGLGGELLGVLLQLGLDGLQLRSGAVERLGAEREAGRGEFLGAVLEVLQHL